MEIDEGGRYLIRDYHLRPPFASFLPGIAGLTGIPVWVFLVNRGQAVCSFGLESKESPIVEFQPANKAYRTVSTLGFRTFIKLRADDGPGVYLEPFSQIHPGAQPRTEMRLGLNDLEIRDTNGKRGLEVGVSYFVLPNMSLGALVRKLVIKNTSRERVHGEVVDGLPAVIPYGIPNGFLKEMSNTAMAWMRVVNLEAGIPFYRIDASIHDTPEVEEVHTSRLLGVEERS